MKYVVSIFIFSILLHISYAQVSTIFPWTSYSCPNTATANSYTYSQSVNGVTMEAGIYYSGTAANIGWTNAINNCSFKSPAYNSNYLGVTTGGIVLSTDRASSGSAAPTPTVSLVFTPALCGNVTFSIGDINGADFTFRDSIKINAWDGNNNPITMASSMVARSGGNSYPAFVNSSTNLIIYGNGFYDGTVDVITIPTTSAAKVSKINIVYYSGKKDYSGNTISNPSEQHIIIGRITGNAPPTVVSSFACSTNSTNVNMLATATNTSASHTYSWTTTSGTINSGSNALTANVNSPYTYSFTAYNGAIGLGCSTQTVITLNNTNCNLLPIELTDFDATIKNEAINLNWETLREINSDYFTIEHSIGGVIFEPLTVLKSIGNSNKSTIYSYLDENPYPKINYYRLKQTDSNGHSSFSKIIDATIDVSKIIVSNLKPNPTSDKFGFDMYAPEKTSLLVELLDLTGQIVFKDLIYAQEGKLNYEIDILNYSQGIYTLKVSSINTETRSYTKVIKN